MCFRDKDDPEYVVFSSRDYMPQRARISLEDARKKDCQKKYVPKHACIWEAIREHGGGCLPSSLTIAPELMHFYRERRASLREMEILTLDKVLFGGSVAQQPGRRPLILDVSQSAHRIPRQVGFSPCVTPSSRLAVFDIDEAGSIKYAEGRFLLGAEKLSLQGYCKGMLAKPDMIQIFRDSWISSLAGNAFSMQQFGIAVSVSLCVFDFEAMLQDFSNAK